MSDIGTVIRKRREQAGLSQLDLALAVGYKNGGDISRVETGKQWPDAAKLSAIAEAVGCNVWELFAEAQGHTAMHDVLPLYRVERNPQQQNQQQQRVQPPAGRDPLTPPTLDDALTDVQFMLTSSNSPELLAAIAYQGMMTRYATERICSALNSLVGAVESLRDEVAVGNAKR